MPSFPPPGGVTICEINRDLVAADALSDDRAKEAYGDILGMVFSPIPFQPDDLLTKHEPPPPDDAEPTEGVRTTSLASTIAESFKQMLFPSCDGANWDPEDRVALLSFSNSTTLGSIHFSSKPPSLDAHLLPVELPEISSLIVSRGIEKLAWDASGERLALSFKDGNEMYHGLVAVYDVRRSPLVSLSLVGFIRGPGEGAKPLAFAFHNKFKQGPLLSVCCSGWCCTYPLILRPH